jgi:hypothetical protein
MSTPVDKGKHWRSCVWWADGDVSEWPAGWGGCAERAPAGWLA